MCRCIDVDLRYCRLPDCRNDFRGAVIVAREPAPASVCGIGRTSARHRRRLGKVWRLLKCPASLLLPRSMRRLQQHRRFTGSALLSDYWALTKPEVNFLILITTFAGFYLGCANAGRHFSFCGIVQYSARDIAGCKRDCDTEPVHRTKVRCPNARTARRPLAAGRLEPRAVLAFGIVLSVAGSIYLAVATSVLASLLALLTLLSYLFLYTPLKRRTPLCVLVGAFPGAMPPLIGWAAASGRLQYGGVATLRHNLPVAVPAFHGNRMDVPRGL